VFRENRLHRLVTGDDGHPRISSGCQCRLTGPYRRAQHGGIGCITLVISGFFLLRRLGHLLDAAPGARAPEHDDSPDDYNSYRESQQRQ
jgi:hypothetical protein